MRKGRGPCAPGESAHGVTRHFMMKLLCENLDVIKITTRLLLKGQSKVHVRLPGKGNSNSHGARPVHDDNVDSDQ